MVARPSLRASSLRVLLRLAHTYTRAEPRRVLGKFVSLRTPSILHSDNSELRNPNSEFIPHSVLRIPHC